MRPLVLAPALLLSLFSISACTWSDRSEGFSPTGPGAFVYSVRTSTVLTENDDGAAEKLRRDWLADAVQAHGMCAEGYVVDVRRFVPYAEGRFANGGSIYYSGRCLANLPPPSPRSIEKKEEEDVFVK